MKRGWVWPAAVMGLLGLNFTIVGVTVFAASRAGSNAVVEEYYEKALRWDESARQESLNRALGWTPEVRGEYGAGGHGSVFVTLRDGSGAPVRSAVVRVEVFHESDPRRAVTLELRSDGRGGYAAPAPIDRAGLWRARVAAQAVGMRFTAERTFEPVPGGSGEGVVVR